MKIVLVSLYHRHYYYMTPVMVEVEKFNEKIVYLKRKVKELPTARHKQTDIFLSSLFYFLTFLFRMTFTKKKKVYLLFKKKGVL